MRARIPAALVSLFLAAACAASDSAETGTAAITDVATVRQAVEASKQQLIAAFKAGDAAAAAAVYAPAALIMAPNEPAMQGTEAITQGLRGMFEQVSMPAMALTIADLTVSGDHAFEHGSYEWTVQPKAAGAPAMPDKGKYLSVWQRQADGSWKLLRDIWNTDSPAQH
jgi:uncharacterized protein (TIGR02246 family)